MSGTTAATTRVSPSWAQYTGVKRRYPDCILLFRLGDFYETFDDDARTIARELEIVLTAREMGRGNRHPMAGIPFHALDGYLARLVAKGYRVAICEQLTDPADAKRLVERDVVRVVTPGTLVESNLLDARANNYLAAVAPGTGAVGIAVVDISTGELRCCQIDNDRAARDDGASLEARLRAELERIAPVEVLAPAADPRARGTSPSPMTSLAGQFRLTRVDPGHFTADDAAERLRRQYGVGSLEAFGCAELPLAAAAAGAILAYLAETQPVALEHLEPLRTYSTAGYMALDASTRRSLELTHGGKGGPAGSLLAVLDLTRSPMGGRLLRRWLSQPLIELAPLRDRHDAVQALGERAAERARLAQMVGKVGDPERTVQRIGQRLAGPRELLALRDALALLPEIEAALARMAPGIPGEIGNDAPAGAGEGAVQSGRGGEETLGALSATLAETRGACADVAALISRAIVPEPPATLADGGALAPGYAPELDDLKAASSDTRQWMAGLEARERERTGVRSLKVGYNKVFGYYLEVSHAALRARPTPDLLNGHDGTIANYLEHRCGYVRKQTTVGAERYVTAELKEREALLLSAQERLIDLEQRLFRELCERVARARPSVGAAARALATLDVHAAFAEVASRNRYVRPTLTNGDGLEIVGGRHPVVELGPLDDGFVPNDCRLSDEAGRISIVTGPNMAGKSTFLRQIGLVVLMAQVGSFVPADAATIGLVDRVFTRVGAQDDIASGQSTFMVEMGETANILLHATRRSLLILDEIGRGTSTFDGMAIARAIVEHIHDHPRLGCRTLFATHYHELTELERSLSAVRNYRVDVLEQGDQVVFLHRVVPGGANRSYGIHVARLAGIPGSVTRRAAELLRELERKGRRDGARAEGVPQLALFNPEQDPLRAELADLPIDAMTPLDALNELHRLRERARRG